MPPKDNTTFRCPPEILDAIAARATATGSTKSQVIVDALRLYLGLAPAPGEEGPSAPSGVLSLMAERLARLEAVTNARLEEVEARLDATFADLTDYDVRLNTLELAGNLAGQEPAPKGVARKPAMPQQAVPRKAATATKQPQAPAEVVAPNPPRSARPGADAGMPAVYQEWQPTINAFRHLLRKQGTEPSKDPYVDVAQGPNGKQTLGLDGFYGLTDEEYVALGFEVRPDREGTKGPYLRWDS